MENKPKVQREEIDISNTTVEIVTATAAQIRKSKSSNVNANNIPKHKKQLVQIPSSKERSFIYQETAKAIAIKEIQALPPHGGRTWTCIVTISDDNGAYGSASSIEGDTIDQHQHSSKKDVDKKKTQGKKLKAPLFRWYRGRLELAVLPHLFEEIDVIDTKHGLLKSVKDEYESALFSLQEKEKATDLTSRQVTALSTVAWNDDEYSLPKVERKWISPDCVIFKSRSKTIDQCCQLDERDKLIDKVLHGIGVRGANIRPVKPTKKQALEAGYYRFLRDGLWVIGQEEEWIKDRLEELNAKGNKDDEVDETDHNVEQEQKCMTQCHSKITDSEPTCEIREDGREDGEYKEQSTSSLIDTEIQCDQVSSDTKFEPETMVESKEQIITSSGEKLNDDGRNEFPKIYQNVQTQICDCNERDEATMKASRTKQATHFLLENEEKKNEEDPNKNVLNKSKTQYSGEESKSLEMNCADDNISLKVKTKERNVSEETSKLKSKKENKFAPSSHWRLTQPQIDLCYNAIISWYEKVSYTIKARALHSELADGFDVFRERGSGRYDMQVPLFDNEQFRFLTDIKNAAWMPVVKKILGEDATIVHKGAFLSMPGSATQIYHQDGPHLTTKVQRPCHAINVFIPLVDLNMKNGPTEFCVGTHILGYEGYNKELIDTPLAPAGNPIIFDYRLGHRGLGNSSRHARPIVYLTYSAASKEFRDSVNFSRKRYHKLGEIIDKPLSRTERALKRERDLY